MTCLALGVLAAHGAQGSPPSIVVIVADDLGWNDVGYHGSEIRTPNIDRLADRGVELDRFYVQPICSPTRASLMTGKASARLGIYRPLSKLDPGGLPLEDRILPQVLADAGYQSLMVGKWHLGHRQRSYFPQSRGFEHFYGNLTGGIGYWDHNHGGALDWQRNGMTVRETGYTTRLIADEAVHLLETRDPERPTFLFAAFNAPHLPNEAPGSTVEGYPRSMRANRRLHAAMVSELDTAVGRILSTLAEQGMRDNTLIWFLSDNGGLSASVAPAALVRLMETLVGVLGQPLPVDILEFGRANVLDGASDNSPLRGGKGDIYEGGIRVPSVMAWPGQIESGQSDAFVTAQDVLPTVLQAAGLAEWIPSDLDGVGRWQAIRTQENRPLERDPSRVLRVEGYAGMALVSPPWKLIVRSSPWPWGKTVFELYHLDDDPVEEEDLASLYPERVEALKRVLDQQPLAKHSHASLLSVALDPDSFGGSQDREPWAEAAE
ncbi:MAG: arylsulfatase [Myxococcota bacterium]|nr:arylsulfatase [Myxococcota bacterium]